MFSDWDNYDDDFETLELLKRYQEMIIRNSHCFFDLCEYECIIDYFRDQYNYREAVDAVCRAIKQHPEASSMRLRYSQLLLETGKPGKALSVLKSIEIVENHNFEMHLAKGLALNVTGKCDEAESSFQSALMMCVEDKDEVAYEIAQSYLQFEMNELALKYLQIATRNNPSNILALYDLASTYLKIDRPQRSIFYYQKYLDLDPFAEHVWDNLGLVFESVGNKEKAEESFDFALAVNPQYIPAYFNKAEMLLRNNELCRAVTVYEELLAQDNSNTKAMCEMGYCFHQMGLYPEALDFYRQALVVTTECSEAWLGLGSVYLSIGKHILSINMIKKAVLLQPENADYWFMLGKAYSSARKLNKAILAFTKASELNPYDYDTWIMCAQLLFKKRRITEAISMLQQLLECNNDDPVIHYRLAAYCAYQGDLSAAQMYLKQGLRLNYQEHTEMFRLFPKTRTLQLFRQIIDNNHQSGRVFKKSR